MCEKKINPYSMDKTFWDIFLKSNDRNRNYVLPYCPFLMYFWHVGNQELGNLITGRQRQTQDRLSTGSKIIKLLDSEETSRLLKKKIQLLKRGYFPLTKSQQQSAKSCKQGKIYREQEEISQIQYKPALQSNTLAVFFQIFEGSFN